MTMIIGLNLSNRLYLAADSRVTSFSEKNQQIIGTSDNILKIMPLWGKNILDQGFFDENYISMAVAGNVEVATYFYNEITQSLKNGELNTDIRIFYDQIDNFIKDRVNNWTLTLGKPYKNCTLLFAGVSPTRNKQINLTKLQSLILIFEQEARKNKSKRNDVELLVQNDPIWIKINEKMIKEAGKTVVQSLEESDTPEIPLHIQNAISNNKEILDSQPDSLIFAVSIKMASSSYEKNIAEWGEFLAFGAQNISKNDCPENILSLLELFRGKEKNNPHLLESVILTNTILDLAKDRNINSIGGTVFINSLSRVGSEIMGKDFIKPDMVRVGYDIVPLLPFSKFKSQGKFDAEL